MALQRFTAPVDGTIPVQALLYTDEQLLISQEGVGIYDGLQKSPPHQSGTIYNTSHRLIYIDNKDPEVNSFALDLGYVSQTEYYAGLFTSSSKITLYLIGKSINASNTSSRSALSIPGTSGVPDSGLWECDVCGNKNRNPPGHSPSSTQVCELCGVPRSSTPSSSQQLSSSLPSNSIHQPTPFPQPSSGRPRRPSSISCQACTFLNHPSLVECEMCGTRLPTDFPADTQPLAKSAPATRPVSPDPDDNDDPTGGKMMKVSFRKGGDKGFYTIFKRSLKSKAWENQSTQLYKSNTVVNEGSATTKSGITGILRSVETSAQGRDTDLKNSLQDLEALMIKARDMVNLAGELNEKLTFATSTISTTSTPSRTPTPTSSSQSSNTTQSSLTLINNNESRSPNNSSSSSYELPEEATFIRSSLSQLGLQMTNVPVTNDMIKDEDKWINELARELGEVLRGMMRDRGIIALDEVWGGWNRARGVALLPPSTLLLVIPHLPNHTSPPIHTRTFTKSGLSVLHTPPYTRDAFAHRLTSYLKIGGPKTTMEVAMNEGGGLTVALVREMIDEAEMNGDVLRDDVECIIRRGESEGGKNREGEEGDEGEEDASWASVSGGGFALGVGEAGVRWWPNVFVGYVWDGHTFDDENDGR